METDVKSSSMPALVPSKDEAKNDVIEVFDVKVECVTSVNGTKTCKIREISVDIPTKNLASEAPTAPSSKDKTVTAVPAATPATSVPAATPVAAAPRELAAGNDAECRLCRALADALREQVKATAVLRRGNSSVGRRMSRS